MSEKKEKKRNSGAGMGYCPIFFSKFESQYNKLYYDRQGWEAAQGRAGACSGVATTRPGGLATQPHDMANRAATRSASSHGVRQRARMA